MFDDDRGGGPRGAGAARYADRRQPLLPGPVHGSARGRRRSRRQVRAQPP